MAEEEARRKAEEIVYADYTVSNIIWACKTHGIQTYTKNKRRFRSRTALEADLIKAMTKKFMEK